LKSHVYEKEMSFLIYRAIPVFDEKIAA